MSPASVKCACPSCTCEAKDATLVVRNGQNFCSDACATGHPNHEPCHGSGSCGCECAG
ncbi:metallothionein [Synechococcus sp. AH-601-N23]|nr:metallothionein [Synechococcus sp. AH-601-N23]MDB4346424.1 metallothionein [bacterium]